MFKKKNWLLSALVSALASCAPIDYEAALPGEFSGSLFVMWVGEGGAFGEGAFLYVPNPKDPLTFTRNKSKSTRVIRPQLMYTDGGTIPNLAQVFKGFGPWGYAPAYMIHDWLFVARHCITDGTATPKQAELENIAFRESAEIIAEAIKTLIAEGRVAANDVAPSVISSTVAGPISSAAWHREGACEDHQVSVQDKKAAELAIPGSTSPVIQPRRTLPDGRQVPLLPAKIVSMIEF